MMKILETIGGFFSGNLSDSISKLIGNFKADPTKVLEMELALKQTLLDHETKLKELVSKDYEAEIKDRDSARNREVQLQNSFGVYVQNICAGIVVLSFVTLCFLSFFTKIEIPNRDIVMILIGMLGSTFKDIYGYWFGSSKSSNDKQEQINQFTKYLQNEKK